MYYNTEINLYQLIGFFDEVIEFWGPFGFELFALDVLIVGLSLKEYLLEHAEMMSTFGKNCEID